MYAKQAWLDSLPCHRRAGALPIELAVNRGDFRRRGVLVLMSADLRPPAGGRGRGT